MKQQSIERIYRSRSAYLAAQQVIPGGVNSPVRAFHSVGGTPVFMDSAKGAYLTDVDGNTYVDYICSWGPMILGHSHPEVVQAVCRQAEKAFTFGAPSLAETALAQLICQHCPGVDKVRFVSSGTEACMSALRLARGFTGRNVLIKFNGCYHGHADPFLISAGSGVATHGLQSVPGVTQGVAKDTVILPFNNPEAVTKIFEQLGDQIAAVIVEPVAGNMGCVPPRPGFLAHLRQLCDDFGSVLIFDEVMTGFRLAFGGVQERMGIRADLVTYGKVIGGGMPVGAFAGRAAIMDHIAPDGQVYQAGTLSGNPVAMVAGWTTLRILQQQPAVYARLEEVTCQLAEGMHAILSEKGLPHQINHLGSMISVHFVDTPVVDFDSSAASDNDLYSQFFHALLEQGVYLPPSRFESWFLSTCIGDEELDRTLSAVQAFCDRLSSTD